MILAAAITCFINCTEITKAPVDPVTTQCLADKAQVIETNQKQAALIDDLLAKVKELEAKTAKPTRICNKDRVLNARGKCVKGKKK